MPGPPDQLAITSALNALAQANAAWYLEQWGNGHDPPLSAADAGVRHVGRGGASGRTYPGAPEVFRAGVAECGPIAAITAGAMQAVARARGMFAETAALRWSVALEYSSDPGGVTPDYWHAVVMSPGGRFDPTQEIAA